MKIGLMGAMLEEVAGIRPQIQNAQTREIGGRSYITGIWNGVEIVLVFSRWGKVAAASTATTLLDRFGVDGILFIGVAGAANPQLKVGDVVISSELLQHDMDASPLPGLERFEVPLLGKIRFPAALEWVDMASMETARYLHAEFAEEISIELRTEFGLSQPACVTGLVASGDQFIGDPAIVARLRDLLPDLLCVEMEGAAVAQVCYEHERPFVVIRVISDSADHSAAVDFQRFVTAVATPVTLGVAARVIKRLAVAK